MLFVCLFFFKKNEDILAYHEHLSSIHNDIR